MWLLGARHCAEQGRIHCSSKRSDKDFGRIPTLPLTIWVVWPRDFWCPCLREGRVIFPHPAELRCHHVIYFDQWSGQKWRASFSCESSKRQLLVSHLSLSSLFCEPNNVLSMGCSFSLYPGVKADGNWHLMPRDHMRRKYSWDFGFICYRSII